MRTPLPHLVMKGCTLLPPKGMMMPPSLVMVTRVELQTRPMVDSCHQLPSLIHGEGTVKCAKWIVCVRVQDQYWGYRKGVA
jgi:hypothetical protein